MDMIVAVIFVATKLIIHYKLLGYGLLVIILLYGLKKQQKAMIATSLSFLLAALLVIGLPYGIIKTTNPEVAKEEENVMEEVRSWW